MESVWISDGKGAWVRGECDASDRSRGGVISVRVHPHGESVKFFNVNAMEVFPANPLEAEVVEDVLQLPVANHPCVLHEIVRRCTHSLYTTWSGPVLISVNPWRAVPGYRAEDALQALANPSSQTPHIFTVAARAFHNLRKTWQNQLILVSGDSGAGKSENAKFVLKLLSQGSRLGKSGIASPSAKVSPTKSGQMPSPSSSAGAKELHEKVAACSPILESFGNACTTRNPNSSRFGKFVDALFDSQLKLRGARVRTYLLEQSRVVYQQPVEQGYHIMHLAAKLLTESPGQLSPFVSKIRRNMWPHGCQFPNQLQYLNSIQVKSELPFSIDQLHAAFVELDCKEAFDHSMKVIGTVLALGNIIIEPLGEGSKLHSACIPLFSSVAESLGVTTDSLQGAMCHRKMKVGPSTILAHNSDKQAKAARDGLAKALYLRVFNYLVARVNAGLTDGDEEFVAGSIGTLDLFGFEIFEINRFEQLCINYANERLQGLFISHMVTDQKQLYKAEGVPLPAIDSPDNSECLELFDTRFSGLVAILDEQSTLQNGCDSGFVSALLKQHPKNKKLSANKRKKAAIGYTVRHFAGDVAYDADGTVEANRDSLLPAILECLKESSNSFIKEIFSADFMAPQQQPTNRAVSSGRGRGIGSKKKPTLIMQFRQQLNELMHDVQASQPQFVRCINPLSGTDKTVFHAPSIDRQLKCSGVIAAGKVARSGYPVQIKFEEFNQRFSVLLPDSVKQEGLPAVELCARILSACEVSSKACHLGRSLLFMKEQGLNDVEDGVRTVQGQACIVLQSGYRCWKARRDCIQRQKDIWAMWKASSVIQAFCRAASAYLAYQRVVEQLQALEQVQEASGTPSPQIAKPLGSPATVTQKAEFELQSLASLHHPLDAEESTPPRPSFTPAPAAARHRSKKNSSNLSILRSSKSKSKKYLNGERTETVAGPLNIRVSLSLGKAKNASVEYVRSVASLLALLNQAIGPSTLRKGLKSHRNSFYTSDLDNVLKQHALSWVSTEGTIQKKLKRATQEKANEFMNQVSQSIAAQLFNKLLSLGTLIPSGSEAITVLEDVDSVRQAIAAPETIIRFLRQDKRAALNCPCVWPHKSRHPQDVIKSCLESAFRITNAYSETGVGMYNHDSYLEFEVSTAELQRVDLMLLRSQELRVFYVNVYNLMVIHAAIGPKQLTPGKSVKSRLQWAKDVEYVVGGYVHNLLDIETFLFSRKGGQLGKEKTDSLDHRLHFALCWGCASGPRPTFYSPDIFDNQLHEAVRECLLRNLHPDLAFVSSAGPILSNKTVVLPSILSLLLHDFRNSKRTCAVFLSKYLTPFAGTIVRDFLASHENAKIRFGNFNWDVNVAVCFKARPQTTSLFTGETDWYSQSSGGSGSNQSLCGGLAQAPLDAMNTPRSESSTNFDVESVGGRPALATVPSDSLPSARGTRRPIIGSPLPPSHPMSPFVRKPTSSSSPAASLPPSGPVNASGSRAPLRATPQPPSSSSLHASAVLSPSQSISPSGATPPGTQPPTHQARRPSPSQ